MIGDARLQQMAVDLVSVPGVRAVALGGSRARGTHRPDSDVDLGVYYAGTLDLRSLRRLARSWDQTGSADVAAPGAWGPWVNGGAWLRVDDTPVDWILRDLEQVREQSERALAGLFAFHAQPGHPLGFLDVSYAGEVATCRPLADPEHVLSGIRARLTPYPPALREALLDNLWQAEFVVSNATKGIAKRDLAFISLSCSTALLLCAHAWHASAGVWVTNEKGLIPDLAGTGVDTGGFAAAARAALVTLDDSPEAMACAIGQVRDLVEQTRAALAHGSGR